jgi:hypothetical protein
MKATLLAIALLVPASAWPQNVAITKVTIIVGSGQIVVDKRPAAAATIRR